MIRPSQLFRIVVHSLSKPSIMSLSLSFLLQSDLSVAVMGIAIDVATPDDSLGV
jgi:hypothetical protein